MQARNFAVAAVNKRQKLRAPGPCDMRESDQRFYFGGAKLRQAGIDFRCATQYVAALKKTLAAVQRWANDDLRSLNAQIEFVLREALRKAGRLPKSK